MRTLKHFIFLVFGTVIVLCLTIIAGELLFRLLKLSAVSEIESVSDYVQLHVRYGLEPKANLHYREYDIDVQTNSYGMYSPQIPIDKSGTRIAYIGDSYTVGPGIPYTDNFPYKVTENLKAKFPNLDYFVGGLGGSSAMPQSLLFSRKYKQFQPDIVVYELYDDLRRDYYWQFGPYLPRVTIWNSTLPILKQSALVQQLMKVAINIQTKTNERYYNTTKEKAFKDEQMIWDKYTGKALDDILATTKQMNTRMFLVLLPAGGQFDNEYATGAATRKPNIMSHTAAKWAKENHIPYVDLYEPLLKHNTEALNELYLDEPHGYHLTVKGAQIVSDEITKMIVNSVN